MTVHRGAGQPPPRQRGFTLLEAIVALTVFSICALALYGWLAVNVNALVRVEARNAAVRDGRTALAILETVNPMAEPRGERALPGDLTVRWTSREVERKPGKGPSGAPLIFDVGLYALEVSIVRDARIVDRFEVRRAGWVTTRSLQDDDF